MMASTCSIAIHQHDQKLPIESLTYLRQVYKGILKDLDLGHHLICNCDE